MINFIKFKIKLIMGKRGRKFRMKKRSKRNKNKKQREHPLKFQLKRLQGKLFLPLIQSNQMIMVLIIRLFNNQHYQDMQVLNKMFLLIVKVMVKNQYPLVKALNLINLRISLIAYLVHQSLKYNHLDQVVQS